MERKSLFLNNMIGYQTEIPPYWDNSLICEQVFKSANNFIFDLLDLGYYSDGPIYFVGNPFSSKKEIMIFTTIGNKIDQKQENTTNLIYEEQRSLVNASFQRLLPRQLDDYYQDIRQTYQGTNISRVRIYHVLFYRDQQLVVDVYCEVPNDK